MISTRLRSSHALCVTWLLIGCSGELTKSGGESTGAGGNAMSSTGGSFNGGQSASGGSGASENPIDPNDPNSPPVVPEPGEVLPAPATRAARLTHLQWVNTVNDLLQITNADTYAQGFRGDPRQGGFLFDNNGSTLVVDQALWKAYQDAASAAAAFVTDDDSRFAKIAPPADAADRAKAFIESFGLRAFRRPLTQAEVGEYQAVFAAGEQAYPGVTDRFRSGLRLTIEAFLQAPDFLYRVETSSMAQGKVIPLSGYEVASRLSYALWNTMPDAALLGAAPNLNMQGAAEQARRMLADVRAKETLRHFGLAVLERDRYGRINPSAQAFPDAPSGLSGLAARENDEFLDHVLFDKNGGLAELFTSTETFVNADLAKVYGLSGNYTSEFQMVNLKPEERSGFLTQVGFLAANSTSENPDPIHRGVFIANRLLCMSVAAPPIDIPPLPAQGAKTNRENVAEHTAAPACAACHANVINPLGFPFESYDAVGGFRTMDNGNPVDTSASVSLDGKAVAVSGAVALTQALAQSATAHRCFSTHILEFALGRHIDPVDAALLDNLAASSQGSAPALKDLLAGLVASPAFVSRSLKELP